jgi:hypothetical protein
MLQVRTPQFGNGHAIHDENLLRWGSSPWAILSAVEEIRPHGKAARWLVPFMGGFSVLGLLILVSSIAMHLSPRTEGFGGTMFAIGAVGVAYLVLWLRNACLFTGLHSSKADAGFEDDPHCKPQLLLGPTSYSWQTC